MRAMDKQFITEEELLQDAFRLGAAVYQSGFRPSVIVGLWRGGSTVGIAVQECLQHLGIQTDHISIRTSYRGMQHYEKMVESDGAALRVHGTQYLLEHLNAEDRLLVVDDVYSTGRNVEAVIRRLKQRTRLNMPEDVRVAAPWYKPARNRTGHPPDYYLHATDRWLVLPYEMNGLTREEICESKPFLEPILADMEAHLAGT